MRRKRGRPLLFQSLQEGRREGRKAEQRCPFRCFVRSARPCPSQAARYSSRTRRSPKDGSSEARQAAVKARRREAIGIGGSGGDGADDDAQVAGGDRNRERRNRRRSGRARRRLGEGGGQKGDRPDRRWWGRGDEGVGRVGTEASPRRRANTPCRACGARGG
ncbi:hypothetical protein Mp_5g11050 [Marchantia polymorpha subsp. ruderalis]|uniref:Uncharacterized protein n=2 Tax=Marchantia polymorpha TaxID=3197 RepID=A0AAF6BH53_MARPO|nr:hypothetical protein MARPO_0093s0027 [Marchantia polymorpha]BBN11337.1 hypothetical protein Mp_5g11050 [Marchantia polymorpha subsp. ruderalis]|eukprot:PTQ32945.1 hypothetical protein MARPO_0093s0027 [Marchantia polymorpha]